MNYHLLIFLLPGPCFSIFLFLGQWRGKYGIEGMAILRSCTSEIGERSLAIKKGGAIYRGLTCRIYENANVTGWHLHAWLDCPGAHKAHAENFILQPASSGFFASNSSRGKVKGRIPFGLSDSSVCVYSRMEFKWGNSRTVVIPKILAVIWIYDINEHFKTAIWRSRWATFFSKLSQRWILFLSIVSLRTNQTAFPGSVWLSWK